IASDPNMPASGSGSVAGDPLVDTGALAGVVLAAVAGVARSPLCPITTIETPMTASTPAAVSSLRTGPPDGARPVPADHESTALSVGSRNSMPPMPAIVPRPAAGGANDRITVGGTARGRPPSSSTGSAAAGAQLERQRAAGRAHDRPAERRGHPAADR